MMSSPRNSVGLRVRDTHTFYTLLGNVLSRSLSLDHDDLDFFTLDLVGDRVHSSPREDVKLALYLPAWQ